MLQIFISRMLFVVLYFHSLL